MISTMKLSGKSNRIAGHIWERAIVKRLLSLFPGSLIGTSRKYSKQLDDSKVDIYIDPASPIANWKIQCKKKRISRRTRPIEASVLDEMPDGIRILATRLTWNVGDKGSEEYITMKLEDFEKLIHGLLQIGSAEPVLPKGNGKPKTAKK